MNILRSGRRAAWTGGVAVVLAVSLAGCGNVTGSNDAEDDVYPTGPITLVIGQDPGGSTDTIGRTMAQYASDVLGVPIPVVNKPGANGTLATKEVAESSPDGYELILLNATLITITSLTVPPDEAVTLDNLDVITGISQDDYVLVANADSGYATVQDLIDAEKSFNFATTGVGTGSQLAQDLLFKQAGLEGTAVPFDGGSPALTAVLGNQVDLTTIQLGEAMPQIDAGKLTPIVVFSPERLDYLPDVPTATEEGYDVPVSQYRAIAGPKGLPQDVKDTLTDAFNEVFAMEEYQQFNTDNFFTPAESTPSELVDLWGGLADKYQGLVEKYDLGYGPK